MVSLSRQLFIPRFKYSYILLELDIGVGENSVHFSKVLPFWGVSSEFLGIVKRFVIGLLSLTDFSKIIYLFWALWDRFWSAWIRYLVSNKIGRQVSRLKRVENLFFTKCFFWYFAFFLFSTGGTLRLIGRSLSSFMGIPISTFLKLEF